MAKIFNFIIEAFELVFKIIYYIYKLSAFLIFTYTLGNLANGGWLNITLLITSFIAIYKTIKEYGDKKTI